MLSEQPAAPPHLLCPRRHLVPGAVFCLIAAAHGEVGPLSCTVQRQACRAQICYGGSTRGQCVYRTGAVAASLDCVTGQAPPADTQCHSTAQADRLTPARHHSSPFFTQFSDNRYYFQLLFAVIHSLLRFPALSCADGMVPVPAA